MHVWDGRGNLAGQQLSGPKPREGLREGSPSPGFGIEKITLKDWKIRRSICTFVAQGHSGLEIPARYKKKNNVYKKLSEIPPPKIACICVPLCPHWFNLFLCCFCRSSPTVGTWDRGIFQTIEICRAQILSLPSDVRGKYECVRKHWSFCYRP